MRRITMVAAAASLGISLGGCAAKEMSVERRIALASPAVSVAARGETAPVGTSNADAADDPAIWRNAADPAASLIVGTDKKAGLYVYGLDGKVRDFLDAGRVNNVDLKDGVPIRGETGVLVVASDRNDVAQSKLALFRLDTATGKLTALGTVAAGAGEAYGVCLYRDAAGTYAFMVLKDGTINQVALDAEGATPSGSSVRTMKLGTQSEGCAADDRTGTLYVAEEDVGVWKFDARANGSTAPMKIAAADGRAIVADAEGVAIAMTGEKDGYVLVSSQGDNAYAVYRIADDSYVGRFRIAAGAVGSTEETDGIEVMTGDFGPGFSGGLFVAQDGQNGAGAQNFKLVAWDDIAKALGLPN
ncbi:3-phytase [Sphingomonas sp. Root50]|nr:MULTISPECIES: phytase [unclassified Sphingomonas]KQX18352.1 3-phytase [Sphingomonas sp. Root1294]KQY72322.1 3-phytase [Sphingomonas sp. Root50]KRB94405.1 3-phytase [Sphingomonas sp. Root720]